MKLDRTSSIDDLRVLARRRVPGFVFQPIEEGTGRGLGPLRNVDAFSRRRLRTRVAELPVTVDLSTTVFGRRYAAPIGISAIGYAGKMWPGADIALAEAAVAADVPFILSMGTVADVETATRVAPGRVWQQLYAARDPSITDDFLRRAADCGVDVLVHTVDVPSPPAPGCVQRSGIRAPLPIPLRSLPRVAAEALRCPAWSFAYLRTGRTPRLEGWARYVGEHASAREVFRFVGGQMISGAGWREVERVRRTWPGKLVVKGLIDAADVARAGEVGADAVTISNHGGNRMDACLPSLDALAAIAGSPLGGSGLPLFFDGGIRSGEDIAIASALGSAFCFTGRAALYGVLAGGRAGAVRALEIMKAELRHALLHLGVAGAGDLTTDCVQFAAD